MPPCRTRPALLLVVAPLAVGPCRELVLSPNGPPLVLREPRGVPRAGDRSLLTLRFADGRVLHADAEVR